jgi:hypothetical protein
MLVVRFTIVVAIWEKVFGEPYVPHAPRYKRPVVITPSGFGWSEPDGATRNRRLGVFGETALEIETVQWVQDGPLYVQLAEDDARPTLLFTTFGAFEHDGLSWPGDRRVARAERASRSREPPATSC